MSNCCADPKVVTKLSFLESKALNFKKYIESFEPDATVKTYIDDFKPEMLSYTLSSVVVPIVKLGQLDSTVAELVTHLKVPDGQGDDVKKKLTAYLQMFHDVLLE